MALFSEIDWIVIAGVAAFLFFGPQGQQFVRQMGRWYARMVQFKAEIMSEVTSSAGLPIAPDVSIASIGSSLLGSESSSPATPTPMTMPTSSPTVPGTITHVQPVGMWAIETQTFGAGMGVGTWWVATTSTPGEAVRLR
jgi:hypothetical protein